MACCCCARHFLTPDYATAWKVRKSDGSWFWWTNAYGFTPSSGDTSRGSSDGFFEGGKLYELESSRLLTSWRDLGITYSADYNNQLGVIVIGEEAVRAQGDRVFVFESSFGRFADITTGTFEATSIGGTAAAVVTSSDYIAGYSTNGNSSTALVLRDDTNSIVHTYTGTAGVVYHITNNQNILYYNVNASPNRIQLWTTDTYSEQAYVEKATNPFILGRQFFSNDDQGGFVCIYSDSGDYIKHFSNSLTENFSVSTTRVRRNNSLNGIMRVRLRHFPSTGNTYYAAGIENGGANYADMEGVVDCYDSSGTLTWSANMGKVDRYTGTFHNFRGGFYDVLEEDGVVYVSGRWENSGGNMRQIAALDSSDGSLLWDRRLTQHGATRTADKTDFGFRITSSGGFLYLCCNGFPRPE